MGREGISYSKLGKLCEKEVLNEVYSDLDDDCFDSSSFSVSCYSSNVYEDVDELDKSLDSSIHDNEGSYGYYRSLSDEGLAKFKKLARIKKMFKTVKDHEKSLELLSVLKKDFYTCPSCKSSLNSKHLSIATTNFEVDCPLCDEYFLVSPKVKTNALLKKIKVEKAKIKEELEKYTKKNGVIYTRISIISGHY